jgi:riboflavin-specific deaminase-like protein
LEFHQLIPSDRHADALDLLGELQAVRTDGSLPHTDSPLPRTDDSRPYTVVNFVATADGRAAFQGRSGPLGDDADREMFHGLREQADAVMAGTGTLRAEHYGRLIRRAERRERRVSAGRSPEPLMCIVSRTGSVPTEAPVFAAPEAKIVVFGPTGTTIGQVEAEVELVTLDPGEMTLTTALRRLSSDFGVGLLLCEGGPTLFGALLQEGLVDELFLTLAPKLAGGGVSPTISNGPELPELAELELLWALEHAGSLYLRYSVRR